MCAPPIGAKIDDRKTKFLNSSQWKTIRSGVRRLTGSIFILPKGHVVFECCEVRTGVEPQVAHVGDKRIVGLLHQIELRMPGNNTCNSLVQRPTSWRDMRIIGRRIVEDDGRTLPPTNCPEAVCEMQTALALIERGGPTLPFLRQFLLNCCLTVQMNSPGIQFGIGEYVATAARRRVVRCECTMLRPVPPLFGYVKSFNDVVHRSLSMLTQTIQ